VYKYKNKKREEKDIVKRASDTSCLSFYIDAVANIDLPIKQAQSMM
jgi:hypothetical protein